MMTDHVLQFLQYGAPAEVIASLTSSITAPFLPSLALCAADSPALIPHLLPSLCSHAQLPRALAYAGLDYVEIAQSVVEVEAAGNVTSEPVPRAGHDEDERGQEGKATELKWENEDEVEVVDECNVFEAADEKERVRLAILSLRRRAREFPLKAFSSGFVDKDMYQQHEKDEGSMWSNEACLPELLCLLPIAVSRCPTLLTPEQLVKGLLSASSGCSLLVTTFTNNPTMLERGALALANVLSHQSDSNQNYLGSPLLSESASAGKEITGSGLLFREHSGPLSNEFTPLVTHQYAQVMTSVLSSFCQITPSFASICREVLANTCTLAEMALHITVEILHDELQFLSKLIFPKKRTSQWILSFFGTNQKNSESQHGAPPLRPSSSKEKEIISEFKGSPLTHPNTKGVTARVRDALLADARSTCKLKGWCGKLHAHLRLYCVLIRAGDLQPTHEEIDFWIRALGGTLDQSTSGLSHSVTGSTVVSERTLQLGISFLCLMPGLSSISTKTLLHTCVLNLLRAAMGLYSSCTPEIELAVWISVQLSLRRFADLPGLVRGALGMHVSVNAASMRELADAAIAAGVADPFTAASAAAALRPRGPVPSTKKQQCLGLKCLEQLLTTTTTSTTSSAFFRWSIDISDTVMHYICIAGEPVHPVLPSIIQGFIDVSIPRARGGLPRFRMRPFSSASLVKAVAPGFAILRNSLSKTKTSQLHRHLRSTSMLSSNNAQKTLMEKEGNGHYVATAALATYYILCREQIARSMGITGGLNHDSSSSLLEGEEHTQWQDILGVLPLRELLVYMEANWTAYEHLLPQWLCVASIVFPERLTAQALLQDLEKTNTAYQTLVEGVPVTEDLEWVGPALSTHMQENQTAVALSSPSQFDPASDILQRKKPDAIGSLHPPAQRNWTSSMDIDKEHQEMVLEDPGEGRENVNVQSSACNDGEESVTVGSDIFSLETVTAAMRKAVQNPLPALKILQTMMKTPHLAAGSDSTKNLEVLAGFGVDWKLETAMIRELVPHLLENSCPRCLQDQFCSWWRSLPTSTLEYLTPVLLNEVKIPSVPNFGSCFNLGGWPQNAQFKQSMKRLESTTVTLSKSRLAEEPLKLLACNIKVFRSPILCIILDLLLELLVANRRICQIAASDGGRDTGIKREEVASALVVQNSAVCQILLEACLSNSELGDEESPGPLLEARRLICGTICSILHTSPLLLKLLHFQGYDIKLIPMMVEGVPAMVQCLEFIGELLQQLQQQRQVFAIALTAHLTSIHPDLPQSLTVAQQVVGHVTQVRTKVAGCADYLQEVLGHVAQCASTFPSLAPQVSAILQSCAQAGGPLTRFGPPRDATLHAAAVAAFKHLVQSRLLHGRPPPAM